MTTFGDMQDRVMDETNRGGDGNRTQIKLHINEAIKQVDALLRPQILKVTKTLVASQNDYSIATDFLLTNVGEIRHIDYTSISGSSPYPLEETGAERIRELRRTLTTSTFVNLYALDGLDLFLIYPTTTAVGDSVTISYAPIPADLVNTGDIPVGLPALWHEIYEIAAIQSAMRIQDPQGAMAYGILYDKKLGDYRKWRNRRSTTLSRRAVIGRYGRRMRPHDNSTDLRY